MTMGKLNMMKKLITASCLVALMISSPLTTWAQESQTAYNINGNEKESKIVSGIMAANNYNLLLMKMATTKAETQELRDAAQKMLTDHQRWDAQLTALANRLNLGMSADEREKYAEKLAKWDNDAPGPDWDADLVEELVDMHKDGIDMLKGAQASIEDNELKGLAEKAVPQLQAHLDILMPLKGRIKDGKGTRAATPPTERTDHALDMKAGDAEDEKFFSDLRLTNAYELRLVEMVFEKSGNRDLKNAAQQMIEAHQKMEQRTRDYATRKKFTIDADEGSQVNEKLAKWKDKKGGMEWDADVIEELIDAHKDGVDMLNDSRTDVKDIELRTMIEDALNTKEAHLEMLAKLKETIKKPWKEE